MTIGNFRRPYGVQHWVWLSNGMGLSDPEMDAFATEEEAWEHFNTVEDQGRVAMMVVRYPDGTWDEE